MLVDLKRRPTISKRTRLAGLLVMLAVAACSGTSSSAPSVLPLQTAPATRDLGYITKAELGEAWPFTIPAGTLKCYDDNLTGKKYVTFDDGDGIEYALNGSARDFGFPELDETILIDYPDRTATLPLVDRALGLCVG